jgi:hypothetical protein
MRTATICNDRGLAGAEQLMKISTNRASDSKWAFCHTTTGEITHRRNRRNVIEITGIGQWVKAQIAAIYLSAMPQSRTGQNRSLRSQATELKEVESL